MMLRFAFACLLALTLSATAQTTTLHIHVLDGTTGKPVAQQRLLIAGGATMDQLEHEPLHFDATTDAAGTAALSLDPATMTLLQLYPDFMKSCGPGLQSFSVATVLSRGYTAANTCSETTFWVDTKPGELTYFIRKPGLHEKMAW
jgi:hypothetical protein